VRVLTRDLFNVRVLTRDLFNVRVLTRDLFNVRVLTRDLFNVRVLTQDLFNVRVLARDLPREAHEKQNRTERIASALTEIRSKYFTKASPDIYKAMKQCLQLYLYSLVPVHS
jgi:hypothetical protein